MHGKSPFRSILAWTAIFILLSSLLWACVPGSVRRDQPPISFTIGKAVEVASETIGTDGGVIKVNKPGDPLDGLTVEVPEGAYDNAATFTISAD
jgi:hypothetical protein